MTEFPVFGGMLDDPLGNLQDAFAVDQLELVGVDAAFVAAAQERFEEAVVQRIGALLATLDDCFGTLASRAISSVSS